MKGAVLYLLGMNVKERQMRANYGLAASQIFRQGVHPESSKYVDPRGDVRTDVGVEWAAKLVISSQGSLQIKRSGPKDDQREARSS